MAASTLYHISHALDVLVIEFLAGLERSAGHQAFVAIQGRKKLLKTYRGICEPGTQKHVMKLIETVANYRLDGDD